MGKGAPSKDSLDEQLKTFKKLLKKFLAALETRREAAETEPEPDRPTIEHVSQMIRELGDSITQTLVSRDAQRFEAMERRVDALERTIQKPEGERRLVEDALRGAARQPAREPILMKAPNPPPRIDYTPILTAAIETVRDLGLSLLQRHSEPAQKSHDKGT